MTILQRLCRAVLRVFGWTLVDLPTRPDKAVIIGYPHTSNWDFVWTMLTIGALRLDARWVAKDTLFRGIYGPIMRGLGGIAVNRRERTGFVTRVVEEFEQHSKFLLVIAVEGTRQLQSGWKSGFYRIALAANVPVVLGIVDYPKRELGLSQTITLSGDEAADMGRIAEAYLGRCGKRHEYASPIQLL